MLPLEQRLKSVLNSVDDAIIMIDSDLKVVMCNKQFENFFGLPASTILYQDKRKAITDQIKWRVQNPDEFEKRLFWLYEHLEVVSNDEVEVVIPRRRILKRFSGPVYGETGGLLGRVEVYSDITNEVELNRGLQEKNAQLYILNAAATSISESFTLQSFCDTFLRRMSQAMKFQFGLLYVKTNAEHFSLLSHIGLGSESDNIPNRLDIDLHERFYWGHISERKEFKFLHGLLDCGYFIAFQSYDNNGMASGLCIFVWCNIDEMLCYKSHLDSISIQLGIGIDNALLYKEAMRSAILQERDRIAMEMHDGLAQSLGYLGLGLDSASIRLKNGNYDGCVKVLEELREVVDNSYKDVREAIIGLRVDVSQEGNLIDTIKSYIKEFNELSNIDVSLAVEGTCPHVKVEKQLHIIRIIQESLTNVRRHAEATSVDVNIIFTSDEMIITILDNGKGFNKDEMSASSFLHQGMRIMNQRANALGGKLDIQTEKGNGTTISLKLPLGNLGV
jgi:two-component system nitrate/nitrite sensor histidine kinase NarX